MRNENARRGRSNLPGFLRGLSAALLGLSLLLASGGPTFALTFDVEKRIPKLKRIAILPFKNFTADTKQVFTQRRRVSKYDRVLRGIARMLVDRIGSEGWLELVDLKSRLERYKSSTNYQEKLVDAEFLHRTGRKHFKDLRMKDALETLQKAQSKYLGLFENLINPRRFSKLSLTLARIFHNQGNRDRATNQLLTMFAVNPEIYIPARYYDKPFEKRVIAAHKQLTEQRLIIQLPLQNPLIRKDKLKSFMSKMNLDVVVYGYLIRRNGAVHYRFLIYERRRPGSVIDTSIRVENETLARNKMQVDMAFSRWLSCTTFEFHGKKKHRFKRFYFDANFALATYLQHDKLTGRLFPNMGFGFNFSFQIRENLGLFAKFNLWSSLADPRRDLLENFKSIRGVIGVGVTWLLRRWRFYLAGGFDFMGYSENFKTSGNPNCKFFPESEGICTADDINRLDTRFQLGINVALGIQFELFKGVYLNLQGNYTFFFFPFNRESQLNSPLSTEVGLGYRF